MRPSLTRSLPIFVTVFLIGCLLNWAEAQEKGAGDKASSPKDKKAASSKEAKGQTAPDVGAPEQQPEEPKKPSSAPSRPPTSPGVYISVAWLVTFLVVCTAWVLLADWLNRDAHKLALRREWWNLLMCAAGIAGMVVFWRGHPAMAFAPLVLGLVVCGLYVPLRNRRVEAARRIWTGEFVRLKLIGVLARVGIRVNTRTFLRSHVPGQEVAFLGARGQSLEHPKIEGSKQKAEEGVSCLKEIVNEAVRHRATTIDLQPRGEMLKVRYRIDGVFHDGNEFSWDVSTAILQCAKAMAGIDTGDRNRSHVGGFSIRLADRTIAARASVELSVQGETVSLHLADPARAVLRLDKIGLPAETLQELRTILQEKNGLILVCSPTEGGRTTTLYSMIVEIKPETRSVVTIEEPIEYRLKNVTQLAVDAAHDQAFPKVLQAAVAKKPAVLVFGDLDGKQSTHAALREANEGRLVLAAMRADSAVQGLQKLFEWGEDSNVIGGAVRGILAQRLVRRLCPACRQAFKPQEELLKKISVTPESAEKLYKAVGCEKCMKTGFLGRIGIFELFEISDKIRALIGSRAPLADILAEAQRTGHGHIWDDGITKLIEGATSIQELIRVTQSK